MDRRTFLQSLAAAAAAPAFAQSAAKPSLGFTLYGMKSLPLDVALKTCAEVGFSHVEFALNPGYVTEPKVFTTEARKAAVAKLAELKLGLPCLMVNMSLTADDKAHANALQLIADAGALAHELNPATPPILETVLGGKPTAWDEQKAGMAEKLHAWAAAAEKAKTVIAVKAHVGSAVNSPERLLWLLDQVKSPAIQVAYDYSHYQLMGFDMEETMKLLLPRTKFIHVKDSIGAMPKFQFALPGEGSIDYVKYFTLLKQHGYAGPVCFEVSGQVFNKPDYDPITAAKKSFAALNGALAKVG
jgi:inosose dehydratase